MVVVLDARKLEAVVVVVLDAWKLEAVAAVLNMDIEMAGGLLVGGKRARGWTWGSVC